jgi:plasmid maintenance system antidote protein VapI
MRNRSLELAMLKGIKTTKEFAAALNIPLDEAIALLNEENNAIISADTISKCLKYFNCTFEYFTCLSD